MISHHFDIDVVILCGGLGTRLRPLIVDRPKVLAHIRGVPFLDILLDQLHGVGFRRFILATGYLGDHIESHVKKIANEKNISVFFSRENTPLGTGGATRIALSRTRSDTVLVANGDSICTPCDFVGFLEFHARTRAVVSIVLAKHPRRDAGSVRIDKDSRITAFMEKKDIHSPFINAGLYLFERTISNVFPQEETFSLEQDIFPLLAKRGVLYGFPTGGDVIDIGTPERYQAAAERLFPGNRRSTK